MSVILNIKKTINYAKKNGYKEATCAAWERTTARYGADYVYKDIDEAEYARQKEESKNALKSLKITLVVPAYETKPEYMKDLLDSCEAQSYENWELIIADASSTDVVKEAASKYDDPRIRYYRLSKNSGISDNTNEALQYATGDYIGLLDHDDIIGRNALYEAVVAIKNAKEERPILVYSDEDKCDQDGRNFFEPHIKLDFNLDLILSNNYICHFVVVRSDIMKELGLRKAYDGAQDYDLVLRIVSKLYIREKEGNKGILEDNIIHIPKVLYHWRCHNASTAINPQSKMYAYEAGRNALTDYIKRVGWKADIRHNKHLGFYRIAYRNDILGHRDDLGAVGGYVSHLGKITTGQYKGRPVFYAGYMNRMDLFQNVTYLDIRNLDLNKNFYELYRNVTGHDYESTLVTGGRAGTLPKWISQMSTSQIDEMNKKLSRALLGEGKRLLLDPDSVRKV